MNGEEIEFVRFYFREFHAATLGRSATWCGAYINAIIAYWLDEGRGLPDDSLILQSICRCGDTDWAVIFPQIFQIQDGPGKEFFRLREDGLWHQKRALGELEASIEAVQQFRKWGKKGGTIKALKYQKKSAPLAAPLRRPPPRRAYSGVMPSKE